MSNKTVTPEWMFMLRRFVLVAAFVIAGLLITWVINYSLIVLTFLSADVSAPRVYLLNASTALTFILGLAAIAKISVYHVDKKIEEQLQREQDSETLQLPEVQNDLNLSTKPFTAELRYSSELLRVGVHTVLRLVWDTYIFSWALFVLITTAFFHFGLVQSPADYLAPALAVGCLIAVADSVSILYSLALGTLKEKREKELRASKN